ncbi:MAG: cation-translocating P-type ATPase [Actinobacteria bacterium]|nr:cation-translocating P-type ATPase [Actinomycetota bacterium]MCL5447361.1 cation-translocating P-type ATPase [Actinomycetota bacterium]
MRFAIPSIGPVKFIDGWFSGRKRRRSWVANGRAHIEVRASRRQGLEEFTRHVKQALAALDGVQWAEINAITGHVVVAFDPDASGLDDLVEVVEGVEEEHGLHQERFSYDRPEHPGDIESVRRNVIALGADVAGLGISMFGQVLSLTPLPSEIGSLVSLAESEPRVRRLLDAHIGHTATDLGLGLTNAFTQALSQGPLGLVVDITHRTNRISELRSINALWTKREPEFYGHHHSSIDPIERDPRPLPLPRGPVEHYADRASLATFAAFGLGLAGTRSLQRAGNAFVAGVPKAARLGQEAYIAGTSRALSARGVLVMDRAALLRLDRVDTVVLDPAVLSTGRRRMAGFEVIGDADPTEVATRLDAAFDASQPLALVRRRNWILAPLGDLGDIGVEFPRGVSTRARELGKGGAGVLGLTKSGHLTALARLEYELEPLADSLAEEVRLAGFQLVVAGTRGAVARRLRADKVVAGGRRLRSSVRSLQADGHVVLLISGGEARGALHAADCGFGLTGRAHDPPWGAHLLAGEDLGPAFLIVQAARLARQASHRSVMLSLAGSGIGGVWALTGLPVTASRRAALPVNMAALAAQATSVLSASTAAHRRVPMPVAAPPWHAMPSEAVISALSSSSKGLDAEEARRRETTAVPQRPFVIKATQALFDELANPLTPILAVGAGLSAAVGSVTDAVLVAGVTGVNAAIGAAQRLRTEVALEQLEAKGTITVGVRRSGMRVDIRHETLVWGDVVELSSGDQVPADCRILEAVSCEVDESSLTGESFPVLKQAAATPGMAVADRTCMLYEGTTVVAGSALAVVVALGQSTESRKGLAEAPEAPRSGVEARLARISALTVPATVASGAVVTGLGLLRGLPLRRAVGSGVSLMVAAVPEGLPLLANAAQLASARRLSERGALVRNPHTIEALGRVDVLCFDKTGTLTAGHIALQRISDGIHDDSIENVGPTTRAVVTAALRASPSCEGSEVLPHATDQAVVEGAARAGVKADDEIDGWLQVSELAFEPSRGFHAVVGTGRNGSLVAAKGAPEVILPRCTTWRSPDGSVKLGSRVRQRLDVEVERLAGKGLRVLAVAQRNATARGNLVDERVADLELLGFLGMADHVRPTAAAAVEQLYQAGVEVVMITGDHPSTAEAVARELGILRGTARHEAESLDSKRIMTGIELDAMSDAELQEIIPAVSVFARVTPAHKVRIVTTLQSAGRIVAMTGDGANDAAAIRLAYAGIALGGRGASAAREAADLVVTDDRIETIVDAIVEGRAMWASVRDALGILVGGNLGEVAFSVTTAAITGASALGPRQFLLVNLLTDMLPAITIALQSPVGRDPESLLHEGPDASLGSALGKQIAVRAITTAGGATGAWMLARATGRRRRASTVALAALVGTQLAQTAVVGVRSPLVLGSTLASSLVLIGVVQTPVVSQFFGCTPLGPIGWTIAGGAAGVATVGSIIVPRAASYLTP